MKIIFVDDDPVMRDRMVHSVDGLGPSFGPIEICGVAEGFEKLIEMVKKMHQSTL